MSGRRLLAVSPTGLSSGAERVLVAHLAAARERGWTVTVACPPGPLTDALAGLDVPVTPLPELKLGEGPRPAAAAAMAARWVPAARALRRAARRSDVVVVNGVLALPAVRLARVDVPVAWLVHDVVVRRDLALVARLGAPAVRRALAVSGAAGLLAGRLGLDVAVVRNGVRWPVEPADEAPPGPPVVGISGMVTPWKGHAVLLEAMAQLPHAVLEVLGGTFPRDAEHRAAVEARAGRADLAGRVRFLGHHADPLAVMRRWTVAVNASTSPEAASLAVLEAMSLGLPVVATDHGGTPEVLGAAGRLVPPGDADALAGAIAALLDDAAARRACGAVGRAAVAGGLDAATSARRFAAELDALSRG